MTVYTPANAGQLSSGDPEGGFSCVSYSFSYLVSASTSFAPTGRTIRGWTGDHSGGLELQQCDRAVSTHTSVDVNTSVFTRAAFYAMLAKGYGAVLLGAYGPIERSRFSGQSGFFGNHAIYVPSDRKAGDPLADGRHGGYRYHGEVYPTSLLDAFAAELLLSTHHQAGSNHFEASFVRETNSNQPAIRYRVEVIPGKVALYAANPATHTVASAAVTVTTGGFSGTCTPPARYVWTGHNADLRVVRLTSGSRIGKWLNVDAARVKVGVV